MSHLTLLVAGHAPAARAFLAGQLQADGHIVHQADSAAATTAKLCAHAIDIVILAELEHAADAPTLLRALRDGRLHTRVHRAQPVITIGASDELSTLRAYQAGSDHHLAGDAGYLVVRAAIEALARRTINDDTRRHIRIGELHIDSAARSAAINGTAVRLTRTEFDLLVKLASDPTRVFTKAELARAIWGHGDLRGRTLDSHIGRLRQRLTAAGGQLVHTRWGTGWSLTSTS